MGSVNFNKSGMAGSITWTTGPQIYISITSNSYGYMWRLKDVASNSVVINDTSTTSETFYASNNTRYELQAHSPSAGWIEMVDWTLVFDSPKTLTLNQNGYSWSSFPSGGSYWPGDTVYISNPGSPPKTNGNSTQFTITGHANGGTSNTSLIGNKTQIISYSFKEWNSNSSGTGTPYSSGFSMPNSNLTLYAICNTSTSYGYSNNNLSSLPIPVNNNTKTDTPLTVSLNANGGNIDDLAPRTSTTTITYTFDRWTADQAGYNSAPSSFESNTTVYAQWKESRSSSQISLPTSGTKQGYRLVGWALQNSEVIYTNTYTPTSNVTLYAQWEPTSDTPYKVNYYTQNIDSDTYALYTTENKTGYTDSILTIDSIKTDLAGFTYKEAKSNGSLVSQITIKADGTSSIDLYYTRNSYSVNLNKSSEDILTLSGSGIYEYGETVTLHATFEPIYHFTGWTSSDGSFTSQNNPAIFEMPGNNLTIAANCEINTYSIQFNGNGNETGYISAIRNIGCIEEITLPANNFKKEGFIFNGWNREPDGSGNHYADQAIVSTLTLEHGVTITLYAEWIGTSYDIIFDENGGINGPGTEVKEYNVPYTIPNNEPILEGYTFQGWTTTKNGSTVNYRPGDTYSTNSPLTLYAVWKVNSYTNTINHYMTGFTKNEGNTNDGKWYLIKTETFIQDYNSNFILNTNKIINNIPNGFHNTNKYTITDDYNGDVNYDFGTNVTQSAYNMEFNYFYEPDTYNIIYNLDGGINHSENPETYNILYPVIFKPATKQISEHVGWFDNNGNKITGINENINNNFTDIDDLYSKLSVRTIGNIELLAKWQSLGIVYIGNADTQTMDKYQLCIAIDGEWYMFMPYICDKENNLWNLYS